MRLQPSDEKYHLNQVLVHTAHLKPQKENLLLSTFIQNITWILSCLQTST